MSADIIISYDGTVNDDDALALGQLLARAGARLSLAYVRHSHEYDPKREQLAQHDASRRLEQGAQWLGDDSIPTHVVINASTWEGLAQLAESEGASLIVFGSDYRTPPGRVEPGTTAQHLLEGGAVPVAVAPAGLRAQSDHAIASIGVLGDGGDSAASQTAQALAERLGASIVEGGEAELVVVGSQAAAPEGRIALSGTNRAELESARSAVVVVPRGTPVGF